MSDDQMPNSDDSTASIGKWMIIALWVLLLGFGTFFAQKWMEKRDRGQIPVNIAGANGKLSVLLEADRQGHYVVAGQINGQTVSFLVDTGASGVSIPGDVADRLNLKRGRQFPVITANGSILVHETQLNTLAIGDLKLNNVRASVNPSMDGQVGLLGMTFLRHFDLIQRDGFLTIQQP